MRKYLSFLLVCLLIMSSVTTVFASEDKNNQVEYLQKLQEKYGLVIFDTNKVNVTNFTKTNKNEMNTSNLLKLNSLEELEELAKELQSEDNIIENNYEAFVEDIEGESSINLMSSNSQIRHYREWKPYKNGTLFAWQNIWTNFNYKVSGGVPSIVKVNSVSSEITGLNFGYSYTHRSSSSKLSNSNRTCEVNVTGRGLFGVSVAGFDVGVPHTVNMVDKFTLVAK